MNKQRERKIKAREHRLESIGLREVIKPSFPQPKQLTPQGIVKVASKKETAGTKNIVEKRGRGRPRKIDTMVATKKATGVKGKINGK